MALNPAINDIFRSAFEQRCYRLIIEAYQTSVTEKVVELDWNENDISYELYERIENDPARMEFEIHVTPEFRIPKNVPKIKGFADKFPRIDLKMAHYALKQEFKYFFEAKNLKQNSSPLKRRYIKTGIDNFVSGKYENGSLIGYLLEGEINETVKGINSLLDKDHRSAEALILQSNDLLKSYYESIHSNIGILKHLIFDFTAT